MIDKGQRINYVDIQGIAYRWRRTTYIAAIFPVGIAGKFSIRIWTRRSLCEIKFAAPSFSSIPSKRQKRGEEIFARLCSAIETFIKPVLLINLLLEFARNNELNIGPITITPEGLYPKGLLRQASLLPWNQYYSSMLHEGVLYVYRADAKRKCREYLRCSMGIMNAILVPKLLEFLVERNGVIDTATRDELIRMRGGL